MKNNRKGFTLIELMVVSIIMVMIMGAILNFIQPMNKFYQKTQALADTNDIGSTMMNYVDDELRYATDVVVLQDYEGVPKLQGGFLLNASGGVVFPGKFTHAIIIDNDNVRGSLFNGYDPNGTVAHRKGCTGCIMKAPVNDAGINMDKLGALVSEDVFGEYKCVFDASLNTLENESSCISIAMQLWRPRYQAGSYVFDKYGYNQVRDLELVNINLSNAAMRNMKAEFHSTRNGTLDYTQFPKATASVGGNASAMYSGSNKYTYILYTKVVPSTEKIKITLLKEMGGIKLNGPVELTSGSTLDDAFINNWMAIGNGAAAAPYYTNGGMEKHVPFCEKITTASGQDINMYKTAGLTTNTEFYCQFNEQVFTSPSLVFTFKDKYNEQGDPIPDSFGGDYGWEIPVGFWPDDPNTNTGVVDYTGVGHGDKVGEYEFVGWNTNAAATGEPTGTVSTDMANGWFVSGQTYTGEQTFYAIYKRIPLVEFQFFSGADGLADENTQYVDSTGTPAYIRAKQESPGAAALADPRVIEFDALAEARAASGTDKEFKGWEVEDPNNPGTMILLKDVLNNLNDFPEYTTGTAVPVYSRIEDKPPTPVSAANLEVTSWTTPNSDMWDERVNVFTVTVKNIGTEKANAGDFEIEIEMNDDVKRIRGSYSWADNSQMHTAGKFIYFKNGDLEAGQSATQTFQVACTNDGTVDFKCVQAHVM